MNETVERVKEDLKVILCRQCDGISGGDACELEKSECPVLKTAPSQILSHPSIAIIDPEQSLPKANHTLLGGGGDTYTKEEIHKANFVKIIKEAKDEDKPI